MIYDGPEFPDQVAKNSVGKPYSGGAIFGVDYISSSLGVSQKEVLSALHITPRTFAKWAQRRGPRGATQRRLWQMVVTVGRLADVHNDLSGWFHSCADAQAAFKAGDTTRLSLAATPTDTENATAGLPRDRRHRLLHK